MVEHSICWRLMHDVPGTYDVAAWISKFRSVNSLAGVVTFEPLLFTVCAAQLLPSHLWPEVTLDGHDEDLMENFILSYLADELQLTELLRVELCGAQCPERGLLLAHIGNATVLVVRYEEDDHYWASAVGRCEDVMAALKTFPGELFWDAFRTERRPLRTVLNHSDCLAPADAARIASALIGRPIDEQAVLC